jgi:hypothetical protein
MKHRYTWKIGMQCTTNRQLEVDRPVYEGAILIDLLTGDRYGVQKMYEAGEHEKFVANMPNAAIQTFLMEKLGDEDLKEIRRKAGYVPDANCQPFGNLVFFPYSSVAA